MIPEGVPNSSYEEFYRLVSEYALLRQVLAPLTPTARLAFSLCCCERLYTRDVLQHSNRIGPLGQLRTIIDRLWDHVLGNEIGADDCLRFTELCQTLVADSNQQSENGSYSLETIEAIYLTLQSTQVHSLDSTVRVAECARNRIDRVLWKEIASRYRDGIGPETMPAVELAIRSHPLMSAEVKAEADELRFLSECETITENHVSVLRYGKPGV